MRILFITSTRIGDAVLSSGLLAHLIETTNQPRVTVACGAEAAPLFEAVPGLEAVIPITKKRGGRHWLSLWSRCVTTRWDVVVDLRASAIAWLLIARRRLVLRRGGDDRHRVEAIGRLAGTTEPPSPQVWTGAAHEAAAAALMPDGQEVLAVAPTANWPGKQWRAERFAELAHRLTAPMGQMPGAAIAVLGAPAERAAAEPMLAALEGRAVIDLVGKLDLLTAAAVLRRARFFVGNDSALMHMAAATGVPTLGLFGPSREAHYAPWGPRCAVQRTALSYEQLTGAPDYDHRRTDSLMDSLSVDMAEQAARDLWARCGSQ